jgi:hypothetical protein
MTVHHKDLCPCGSGKRYKHCHLPIDQQRRKRALFVALVSAAVVAVAATGWAMWQGRSKTQSALATQAGAAAGGATNAGTPGAGGADAGPNAFGGVAPGYDGRSPTPAQQGTTVQVGGNNGALAPGENPKPWEYDVAKNRHYDPTPGHQHWHTGPPPADPSKPQVTTIPSTGVTATTSSGAPVKISGTSVVQVAPSTALAPGENPKPYEYDAAQDRYFDPSPGHNHWHTGKPPAGKTAP